MTRGNCTMTADGRFEVLGLVSVVLPGPWWWYTEDLNEAQTMFRCYDADCINDDGNHEELGNLYVADGSNDPDEPDISRFEPEDVEEFDRFLEQGIRRLMAGDGRTMLKWMSSHLSETFQGKGLVSAYIGWDQGRERQYMDIRIPIAGRKVIVGCCFDVQRKDDVGRAVYWAVQEAAVNGRLR